MAATPPSSGLPLNERLAPYGFSGVIRLDEKLTSAEQLDYIDLLPKQKRTLSAPFYILLEFLRLC